MTDKYFLKSAYKKNFTNPRIKELMQSNLKRIANTAGRKLTKFSSRFNLRDNDMSRVDGSPNRLTNENRYSNSVNLKCHFEI